MLANLDDPNGGTEQYLRYAGHVDTMPGMRERLKFSRVTISAMESLKEDIRKRVVALHDKITDFVLRGTDGMVLAEIIQVSTPKPTLQMLPYSVHFSTSVCVCELSCILGLQQRMACSIVVC